MLLYGLLNKRRKGWFRMGGIFFGIFVTVMAYLAGLFDVIKELF